jgi:hypothetical protein
MVAVQRQNGPAFICVNNLHNDRHIETNYQRNIGTKMDVIWNIFEVGNNEGYCLLRYDAVRL